MNETKLKRHLENMIGPYFEMRAEQTGKSCQGRAFRIDYLIRPYPEFSNDNFHGWYGVEVKAPRQTLSTRKGHKLLAQAQSYGHGWFGPDGIQPKSVFIYPRLSAHINEAKAKTLMNYMQTQRVGEIIEYGRGRGFKMCFSSHALFSVFDGQHRITLVKNYGSKIHVGNTT